MKYILILLLLPFAASSQTYKLRRTAYSPTFTDSLYLKDGGSSDSFYRKVDNVYTFAFKEKIINYLPYTQLINAPAAGTDYLSPSGDGSALTGITQSQVSGLTSSLSAKAPLASPTFTGTVSGITAAMVGLGNVTNESKATMFSNPTFTGTVTYPAGSAAANLSGTNTGDNATNTQYASDYRAANFVAGTNYLAPNGSAAALTSFPTLNQNTTGTAANITASSNSTLTTLSSLSLPSSQVTGLGELATANLTASGNGLKVVRANALGTGYELAAAVGTGTVTDVIVTDGGGLDLTVTNSTTTPTISGIVTGATTSFALSGVTTPAQYTSDQNDVDPSTNTVLRVNSNSDARKITSISGGASGRILMIQNVGTSDIILTNDDGSSGTAANRFSIGGDIAIAPNGIRILQYDATISRWKAAGYENNLNAMRRAPAVSWDYLLAGVATANFPSTAISTGTMTYVQELTDHPGYMTTTSSTTTNSGAHSYLYGLQTPITFKGGEVYEAVFMPKVASNTNTTIRMGFMDATTSADAVDGAYIEIPAGSFAAVGKTASNSTRTTSATIATLAVDTWYRVRIEANRAASSVTFTIFDANGVSLGSQTNSANIPTGAGRACGAGFISTNVGTTATLLTWLDYQAVQFGGGKLLNR